jgi:uncharacterized protein
MYDPIRYLLVSLAALAAGMINALAGGGTLLTFPTLVALGIPPVAANVTNTVALCPGFIGGTLAQARDLKGQGRRLWMIIPAGVIGGLIGGFLLLHTAEKIFRILIPYLILGASLLLAIQEPLRAWLVRRSAQNKSAPTSEGWTALPIGLAAIYGGYFGAGLSVIVLAVLGLVIEDSLTRLNAIKQALGFSINTAAAVFFVFSGQVVWSVAAAMAVGALLGGSLGGRLAGKVRPATLRWLVVSIGILVSIIYFVRG